jgi:hypothetical protein
VAAMAASAATPHAIDTPPGNELSGWEFRGPEWGIWRMLLDLWGGRGTVHTSGGRPGRLTET